MLSYYDTLLQRIENKDATVAVIGLGYVGLPLAIEFAKKGFQVYGYDISEYKINLLKRGESYIQDVNSSEIGSLDGRFVPISESNILLEADIISICVPTPLTKYQQPDLTYIVSAIDNIKTHFKPGKLVILESTTYPGTTEEVILKEFTDMGYKVGEDFFLCFSPERVDPGNSKFNTKNTPKVVGGVTDRCNTLGGKYYGSIINDIVSVSSPKVAEMTKLMENTFRSINISFVNEMAIMCDKLGIDIWEVIEAAKSKPFGFMPFYPGPGIGGHCIPLDPMYLSWKAKGYNFFSRFIELAQDINKHMPEYVIQRLMHALNKVGKPLHNSKVLILGMSYKPNIDDLRESPGLELFELLRQNGAEVFFNDPYVTSFKDTDGSDVFSIELNYSDLANFDCILLATNHSFYNYEEIYRNSSLIFDTRNGFKNIHDSTKIVKLGGGN
ncbi:nucleotide sugar dehydrogenase [Paenibacillus senegalimassiliensis]|uniref:nucleotide sugar dehydrogenase n=1 Tax=Paenibacillus senegalimassiliensis TaxID=1737426 RepID=UPI000B76CFBC|nr:nucleotide sugar dehydrogenase [Paenibacillus senegalimassiliensis]